MILRIPPLIPTTPTSLNLSSTHTIPHLSITTPFRSTTNPTFTTIIRMGGGPRTFPGGVSKWQWKRMQQKKQKQLLKARLCRERQIYEMRKRAELRAAVSELERPWEVVERAPTLFSVSADEQLKTLADRFQKPGGYDLWSESDGPQLFGNEGILPSARFLPKGAVHSVKPYGIRGNDLEENEGKLYNGRKRRARGKGTRLDDVGNVEGELNNLRISSGKEERGSGRWGLRNKGSRGNVVSKKLVDDKEKKGGVPLVQHRGRGGSSIVRQNSSGRDKGKPRVSQATEVYDMSLKRDGSYELQRNQHKDMLLSGGLEDDF